MLFFLLFVYKGFPFESDKREGARRGEGETHFHPDPVVPAELIEEVGLAGGRCNDLLESPGVDYYRTARVLVFFFFVVFYNNFQLFCTYDGSAAST